MAFLTGQIWYLELILEDNHINYNNYIYALAQTHYFSDSAAPANANVEQILTAIKKYIFCRLNAVN